MRAIMAVVVHELREYGEQLPYVEHDAVIETLFAKGPNYPSSWCCGQA
jgi:hypothetical protein